MISVIIPTLDEEGYLPRALRSVRNQGVKDLEIIVADAGSKDRTVEIAKEFDCKVVKGGMPGKGRNEGAKAARGDIFIFLDADAFLSPGFLKKFISQFEQKRLDIAGCSMRIPSKKPLYRVFEKLYTLYFKSTEKFYPHATNCIVARRWVHEKVSGFDETLKLGEDFEYVRACARQGKFGFLTNVWFYASPRRAEADMGKIMIQYFLAELYMTFIGPIKSDIFKYRFGHKKEKKESA
ncbi:MAG: glycosyltransferase [Candidatus Wildermuthbacteria bacterium]|nr:glycosyltransferase [Candidatus Wildermuthbacteria bacterium]